MRRKKKIKKNNEERPFICPKNNLEPTYKKCKRCKYVCEIRTLKGILEFVICKPPQKVSDLVEENDKVKFYKTPLVELKRKKNV